MGVVRPPKPTPEVVMAPTGVYWRREANGWLSMPPVSDDNDMLLTPLAVYRLVGWEDVNGAIHPTREEAENAPIKDGT